MFVWIGSIIWAVVAANNANSKAASGANININTGTRPVQQNQSFQPVSQQQPVRPPIQQPLIAEQLEIIPETRPIPAKPQSAALGKHDDPVSADPFSDWVTKNKRGLVFALGGVVIILILVVAIKYVVSLDFSHKNHVAVRGDSTIARTDTTAVMQAKNTSPSTNDNNATAGNNYYTNGRFTGAYFEICAPSDFIAKPSMKSNLTQSYESAFFDSPDGEVEFYVFSAFGDKEPTDIEIDNATEKTTSTYTQGLRLWTEIQALDGSYLRAYQFTRNKNGDLRWVVGLKYKSKSAYDRYKSAYLAFKKSFVQTGD